MTSPGDSESSRQATFRPRVQVEAQEHYYTSEYLTPQRFFSFGLQVNLVRDLEPKTVLEIGPGPGIVTDTLRKMGLHVVTLDLDSAVGPDLVGDAGQLPLTEGSVDVVLCSQVLEHMPFDRAQQALVEFRRVATEGAVVSLPDTRPFYFVHLALPKLRFEWRTGVPWHRPPPHTFEGEHHWALGSAGYGPDRFVAAAEGAGWSVATRERPLEHSFHHFFVLQ